MDVKEMLKLPFGELLDEFKTATGMSQNNIAKAIGLSSGSQLSQIRHGTYKGDSATTEEKARTFIFEELKKSQNKVFPKPIVDFKHIENARGRINRVIKKNKIILLRGNSGTGKTTILRELEKKHPNNFFIKAYKGMTRRELIRLISEGCGASSKSITIAQIKGSMKNKLLILDEANKLSGGSLEWLRSLQDESKSPMVWAGTYDDIDEVLARQSELHRRCRKAHLHPLKKEEVRALVMEYELKHTEIYVELLWKHFEGQMGLCVEVLDDMKDAVINSKNKNEDNEKTFMKMIELME